MLFVASILPIRQHGKQITTTKANHRTGTHLKPERTQPKQTLRPNWTKSNSAIRRKRKQSEQPECQLGSVRTISPSSIDFIYPPPRPQKLSSSSMMRFHSARRRAIEFTSSISNSPVSSSSFLNLICGWLASLLSPSSFQLDSWATLKALVSLSASKWRLSGWRRFVLTLNVAKLKPYGVEAYGKYQKRSSLLALRIKLGAIKQAKA